MSCLPLSRMLMTGRAADHPVALRNHAVVPFARFYADVADLTRRLRVSQCRRIGLWCLDGYAFAVGLLAIAHAGAEAIIPPNAQPGLLNALAAQWDGLISDDPTLAPTLAALVDDPAAGPLDALDGDGCAVTFFTSGTTAEPKRVARSLGQLEREALALDALLGAPGLGATLATVSHQHAYGLAFKVLWPLSAGRPFASRSHEVWETLLPDLVPGSVLVSSPAHLSRLGGLEGEWRPALVLSAGAPLPMAAAQHSASLFGVAPVEIYGSTETGAIASRTPLSHATPWIPLPGIQVTQRADGCLRLSSPWVVGCHDGDDVIAPAEGDGFVLHGRADRVVKVAGKRVSLAAVEAALTQLPEVSDAAVTLSDGERDQLAAALVLSPEGEALLAQLGPFRLGRKLRALLAGQLEPLSRPQRWRFVAVIPAAALGKRQDSIIAALFKEPFCG